MMKLPHLENMSPNDYIKYAKDGNIGCPVCRSRKVQHEYVNQPSDDVIEQNVVCGDCGVSWKEEYHMVTYYDVKYPKENDSE